MGNKQQPAQAQKPVQAQSEAQQQPKAGSTGAYIPPTWATKVEPLLQDGKDDMGLSLPPMCGFSLSMTPPSERSFDLFFKDWFKEVHFPAMSSLLKKELVARAKQKGFFSGLSSQFKKWAMANTVLSELPQSIWVPKLPHC